MNPDEPTIERILRRAPAPPPMPHLLDRLRGNITLRRQADPVGAPASGTRPAPGLREWCRAWWPTAAAATLILMVLAAFAYQQDQVAALRHEIDVLEQLPPPPQTATPASTAQPLSHVSPQPSTPDPRAEPDRLRRTIADLTVRVTRLEAVAAENERLRQALASGPTAFDAELADAKTQQAEAWSIVCVNNLKQLGLAARVYSVDHGDVLPPDFLAMTNELGGPKVLWCPADKVRQPAADWQSYSPANCSYEHLAPLAPDGEPRRVTFRCPIHGHVTLGDGSVQARVALEHPEWFHTRDGRLYLEPKL